MHQFDIAISLDRLASILEAKAKTAIALAEEHAQAHLLDDWAKEKKRSENAAHFANVCRLGAERLKPGGRKSPPFSPPTWEEVCDYVKEKHPTWPAPDVRSWYDHFESVGWKVGIKPMKNWRAAADNGFKRWNANGRQTQRSSQGSLFNKGEKTPPPSPDPELWPEYVQAIGRQPMQYRYAPEWMKREFSQRK